MTDHPFHDRARDLQLDALLHEAAGVLPAPGLADRILGALQTSARPRPASRQRTWLAAAAVILGLGVVGGMAWLQHGGGGRGAVVPVQDPAEQDPVPAPVEHTTFRTLFADYSGNKIVELDENGDVVFELEEVYGAWDASRLENGNLLIVEFSVSRVREVDRDGATVWTYQKLKNPYCAQRLKNGNTLIADTFGSRVIEVTPAGEEVWQYARRIRPFDAERLDNGNTLIADVLGERVLEVDPDGKIVWQVKNLPNVHDADRLPDGNTLVTLRSLGVVREIDVAGETVREFKGLSSPSDADRLPDGNTLIAENAQIRELDCDGKEVWKREVSWAVEVNRTAVVKRTVVR